MIIGVPRETHRHEHRVGLTPFAVRQLVKNGHQVVVERAAGDASQFSDHTYQRAGAQTVYAAEEVYGRADVICRVGDLSKAEIDILKPESIVCGFLHLAVNPKENVARLLGSRSTLIGYEIVRDENGDLPVLVPFSEMAGQMAIHIAAYLLQVENGGRGTLIGSVAGIPPPTVLILGAGTLGRSAARTGAATGAHVIALDDDLRKLTALHRELGGSVVTTMATPNNVERYTAIADVVIGAVLVPGARTPVVVTEEMVRGMRRGSVIVDLSIDQGGCVETSRPTQLDDPTYVLHDVVHYCVPNMTANVARTASRALAHSVMPIIDEIANRGIDAALRGNPCLAAGVYAFRGALIPEAVGETLGIPTTRLDSLLWKASPR